MSLPFFSIIIPTYNRATFIDKTIQSVLQQTYTNFEIIVIDDGSTDNTEQIVKARKDDRLFYYKKENGERGAARNFGVVKAKGNYITFLDSDDILYKNYFSNALESIIKFNSPPFLHIGYEVTDSELNSKYQVDYLKSDDITFFIKGNPLSCTGIFLHKDIAEKYKFNEDRELSGSEDWELWIRVASNVGIKTDNRISAALIDHDSRSVVNYKEDKLVKRKDLAIEYAFTDRAVQNLFAKHRRKIESYWQSYISLHLILSGNFKGIQYLLKAIYLYPFCILEKRTLAILKHGLFNTFKKRIIKS